MTTGEANGKENAAEYDKVTQASLNGLYVKAQELDRGHNEFGAPSMRPPGALADAQSSPSDAVSHASNDSDAQTHATE